MNILTNIFIVLVASLHLYFLTLEMFLWRSPLGLRVFGMSPEKAEATAVLAANQGLYNGFLAAGLLVSFFLDHDQAMLFRMFFLICIIIAGLFGAWTVSNRILFFQAVPAALALLLVLFAR